MDPEYRRITIDYPKTMSAEQAYHYVGVAMGAGRISGYGREYCNMTVFKNGVEVEARLSARDTDIFKVRGPRK